MHAVSSIFSFKIVKFRHNISSKRIFLFVVYSIDRAFVYLPRANEVCEGYVFTRVCLSTGGIPVCLAGGIPACLAGLQEGGGCIPACLAGFQAHTQWGAWGVWQRGVPRPTPGGVYPSMHWGRPLSHSWRLLLRSASYWSAFLCTFCSLGYGGWCTKFFACQPFYVLGKVFLNSQVDDFHTKSKPTVQELWLDNQPHGLFKSVHKGCKLQWVNEDYSSVENDKSHAKSCPWVIAQNHFISVLVASNSTRTKKNWFCRIRFCMCLEQGNRRRCWEFIR